MQTEVVRVDPENGPWPAFERLGRIVREGGLVAFPTETVYGIAVNARDESALRRLHQVKARAANKPLTLHLPSAEALPKMAGELSPAARRLAARYWPGPLTLVIPDKHNRPTGYRVPSVPAAQAFLAAAQCGVAATSANPSGEPPACTAKEVLGHFDGLLDAIIDGGPSQHAVASTVVRLQDQRVEILREGAIPRADILETTARMLLFVCSGNRCRSPFAAALAGHLLARRFQTDADHLIEHGYRVVSAGTDCIRGEAATADAVQLAEDYDLDLTSHRARPVTPSLLEEADLIYVMTAAQCNSIVAFAPELAPLVRLLDRSGEDIVDPYRNGRDAYIRAGRAIHRALQGRLDDV